MDTKSNSELFRLKAELEHKHELKKKMIADQIDELLIIEKKYADIMTTLKKRNIL